MTQKRPILVAFSAALLFCATAGAVVIDGVAAHVNSHTITIGEVTQLMALRLRMPPGISRKESEKLLLAAYAAALDDMINRRLIMDQFSESEMTIPPHIVDQRVESIIDERFGGDRSALMTVLAKEERTFAEWRETIEEQIVVSSMRHSNVEQHVSVSPDAVKRYYLEHPEAFSQPAGVRIRLIVLKQPDDEVGKIENRNQGEAIRARIVAGEDFGLLARQFSQGTAADLGGDRGWIVPEDELRRELAEAVSGMAEGDVSPLIVTPEEIYLIKKEGERSLSTKPFTDVSREVDSKLRQKQSATLYEEWMYRLRADAYVRVFEHDKPGSAREPEQGKVVRKDEPNQP